MPDRDHSPSLPPQEQTSVSSLRFHDILHFPLCDKVFNGVMSGKGVDIKISSKNLEKNYLEFLYSVFFFFEARLSFLIPYSITH